MLWLIKDATAGVELVEHLRSGMYQVEYYETEVENYCSLITYMRHGYSRQTILETFQRSAVQVHESFSPYRRTGSIWAYGTTARTAWHSFTPNRIRSLINLIRGCETSRNQTGVPSCEEQSGYSIQLLAIWLCRVCRSICHPGVLNSPYHKTVLQASRFSWFVSRVFFPWHFRIASLTYKSDLLS